MRYLRLTPKLRLKVAAHSAKSMCTLDIRFITSQICTQTWNRGPSKSWLSIRLTQAPLPDPCYRRAPLQKFRISDKHSRNKEKYPQNCQIASRHESRPKTWTKQQKDYWITDLWWLPLDYRIIIKIQYGINISKTVVREKIPTQTAIPQAMQKCDNINNIGKIHNQCTTQRSP